jgi:hypothetical protein
MTDNLRLHWFAFSFHHVTETQILHASTYEGFVERYPLMGRRMLAKAKENASVGPNAVLLAVSYLGCGTIEEFTGVPT